MGVFIFWLVVIGGVFWWVKSSMNQSATTKYNEIVSLANDILSRAKTSRLELLADLNELGERFNGADRAEYMNLVQEKETIEGLVQLLTNKVIPNLEEVTRWRTDTADARTLIDLALLELKSQSGYTLEELNSIVPK